MAKTDNPRGIAKVARELEKKTPLLEQLQLGEAALVLRRLLAGHPELLPEAEEIARSTLGDISFESIAGEVEDSIRQLSLDDLDGRAGAEARVREGAGMRDAPHGPRRNWINSSRRLR